MDLRAHWRFGPATVQPGAALARASPELTRALSVAADSHLVSPPPYAWFAEKADAQEKQMREDHAHAVIQRSAEQARRAREPAHERSMQADQAPAAGHSVKAWSTASTGGPADGPPQECSRKPPLLRDGVPG